MKFVPLIDIDFQEDFVLPKEKIMAADVAKGIATLTKFVASHPDLFTEPHCTNFYPNFYPSHCIFSGFFVR